MGRAVDSKSEISGSNPTAANFFFVFFWILAKSSAFAEGGRFFCPKKLRIFFKKSLHKLQIR